MKHYSVLILSIILLVIVSCKDKVNNMEGYSLRFFPRKVSYIDIIPGELKISWYENRKFVEYFKLETTNVSKDNLFIWVTMSDSINDLDTSIPNLEQQITFDYEKSLSSTKALDYHNLVELEYRTTEIKSLTITTLNTPLFGKSPRESLNDFFDIIKYDPPVIVSAPTKTLVYGYSSTDYPVSIDEWLSLSPLAQAGMYLVPNRDIEDLPLDVQFVIKMETADGLILHDTMQKITITQ
jgi:hypothetical protein